MDIKGMLGSVGIKARENMFLKAPSYPYAVFTDEQDVRGGDLINCIIDHGITIELYSDTPNKAAEREIEALLSGIPVNYHAYPRDYLAAEDMYMTVYEFDYIEKRYVK